MTTAAPADRMLPDGAHQGDRRGFDLVRWFALVSLVCVVVSGTGTALVLSRFLTHQMLDRDAEVAAEFLQSVVRAERSWSWFSDPTSGDALRPLESFFRHVAELPGVVRANVFDRAGTVLWSSNELMIGRRFGGNHELEEALRGHIAVEYGTEPKEEHVALQRDAGGSRFSEAYLPIWDEQGRQVIGVVEIYRKPDALFAAIDQGVVRVWIAAALSMLLLYLALFGIALRARRLMVRQQRRLVEAEALSAVGAVASAVAHGIRNPLASIRSSAELGRDEDVAGMRHCLADIEREADRLERWVRDLLLQARGEAIATCEVDLNLLLEESVRTFAAAAERQGVVLRVSHAAVPKVQGDAGALGQAIDNLVANAIEAMPRGGELILAVAGLHDGRLVEVAVTDTGGGLPPELRSASRLFFSTKPRGTGLGMLLTRRIVERHAGTLSFEDAGGGTRAAIRLPASGVA